MNLPNHIHFQYSGFTIRFIDLRPKRSENIQVNIYNPDNPGHSVLSMIPITSTTTTDLEEFRLSLPDNVLAERVSSAVTYFARLNEASTENLEETPENTEG
jgi:hypothetical protein